MPFLRPLNPGFAELPRQEKELAPAFAFRLLSPKAPPAPILLPIQNPVYRMFFNEHQQKT